MHTIAAIATIALALVSPALAGAPAQAGKGSYDDLVRLFRDWREFQKPKLANAVPDYSAAAMRAQQAGLKTFRRRLDSIDAAAWPAPQKIDYELVRAEMNGMDFDHRVLRPWSRDPCFYAVMTESETDVPLREGPEIYNVLEIWRYPFPLSDKDAAEVRAKLDAIPAILEQARKNLTEDARDLYTLGIRVKRRESVALGNLAKRLSEARPDMVPSVEKARAAVDDFTGWLERQQKGMKASCGIGIENYNWYMKNVHLVPYTWQQQLTMLQREMDRAIASMRMEEQRNRNLPQPEPPKTVEELRARYNEAIDTFMNFMREEEIFTVPDYMRLDPFQGRLIPETGVRDVFTQIEYRDSLPMKTHMFHWLEKQRLAREPHPSPIRSVPSLYNIWMFRSEGLATHWEELMMQAGLFDKRPRARELVYILIAMRCARGIADLKLHSREFTLDQAVDYATQQTPRGWFLREGSTVWSDMKIYLHQPGYGTTYVIGKVLIDQLMADRSRQLGDKFRLKNFMDEFFASGVIPISLIRWEMTGLKD